MTKDRLKPASAYAPARRARAPRVWLPVALSGVLVVGLILFGLLRGERMAQLHARVVDAVLHARLDVVSAHLWLEELAVGDPGQRPEAIEERLNHAAAALSSLAGPDGVDGPHRADLDRVLELISAMHMHAHERIAMGKAAAAGSEPDRRFDALHFDVVEAIDALEQSLRTELDEDLQAFRRTQWLFLALAVAVTGLLAVRLQRAAHRQQATCAALDLANVQLESRVRERTSELEVANHALQEEVTERRRAEQRLRLAARVFGQTSEAIIITDAEGTIVDVNPAFGAMTGYSRDEVLGENPRLLASGRHDRAFFQNMWDGLSSVGHWQGEIWNRRKDGTLYPTWQNINAVRDESEHIVNFVGIAADIGSAKRTEQRLEELAYFDSLTGLPNRVLFRDRLEVALAAARRHDQQLAVAFVDLDRFKNINDALGHTAGDGVLAETARRLGTCVRDTDTVARFGGDEFVLIVPEVEDSGDVADLARRVLAELSRPYALDGGEYFVTASIGIALYPEGGTDGETLLKNADAAMYAAKERGKACYEFATSSLNTRVQRRLSLETSLRRALERGEFRVFYQPLVQLDSGRPVGLEALVRWENPEQGMVSPAQFIPVAEETGLIVPLGDWVLQQACREFLAAGLADRGLTVAVNLSARQFRQQDLAERLDQLLEATGFPATALELELTEGVLMDDAAGAQAILQRVAERGVSVAVDDFGTGYSSLAYLKRFSVSKLKLDRSFVRDVNRDSDDAAIAQAVVSLARHMGLMVVAEGIETAAQRETLLAMGCRLGQGYLFGRPLPMDLLLHEPRFGGVSAASA